MIKLKKALKVKVGLRSSIMEISYRDDVADRAVAVPNAVADELAKYYEQITSARANVMVRKLDAAIADVQQRLRRVNRELAELSADQPFLGSDKALDAVTTRIDELELERELAGATLSGDVAAGGAVVHESRQLSRIARHEILANDPLYHDLLDTSSRDAALLAVDDVIHTHAHPENTYLAPKVRGERAALAAESRRFMQSPDAYSPSVVQNAEQRRRAQAVIVGDRAKVDALDRVIATERTRLAMLPRASVKYAWLRLQRDSAQADFLTLSSHRTAAVASRAEALALGSVVVVDRAVRADTTTVGMGRLQLAVVLSFVVFALAIGSAVLSEMFDPSLRRAEQFESLYGAPLLLALTTSERFDRPQGVPTGSVTSDVER
jgi:uncharacterized protein involved in exopolysaccharide biosynthesis